VLLVFVQGYLLTYSVASAVVVAVAGVLMPLSSSSCAENVRCLGGLMGRCRRVPWYNAGWMDGWMDG